MKMFKIVTVLVLALVMQTAVWGADAAAPKKETAVEESSSGSKFGRAVLMYLPNVFADLLDIVTVEASFGNTFALDFHMTYFCDFGLENSDAYFVGFMPGHRYGAGHRAAQRMAALCWSYEDLYISQTSGNIASYSHEDPYFNLVRSYTDVFKDRDVDPYSIGGKAAMFFGLAFDLHLMEIPDFFCSLVGLDLCNDNWK